MTTGSSWSRLRFWLGSAVRAVFEEALMRSETEHLRLVLDVADIEPVLGDGLRLVQVVENLVGNAIKFTPAGGRVDVRVHDDDGMALLEVRDTGVGIAADACPGSSTGSTAHPAPWSPRRREPGSA